MSNNTPTTQEELPSDDRNILIKNAEEDFEKLIIVDSPPLKNIQENVDTLVSETPNESQGSIDQSITLLQTNSGQVEPLVEEQTNPDTTNENFDSMKEKNLEEQLPFLQNSGIQTISHENNIQNQGSNIPSQTYDKVTEEERELSENLIRNEAIPSNYLEISNLEQQVLPVDPTHDQKVQDPVNEVNESRGNNTYHEQYTPVETAFTEGDFKPKETENISNHPFTGGFQTAPLEYNLANNDEKPAEIVESNSGIVDSSNASPRLLDKGKGKEVISPEENSSLDYASHDNHNNPMGNSDLEYQLDNEFVDAIPIESQISPTSPHNNTEIAAGVDPLDMRYDSQEHPNDNLSTEVSNLPADPFPVPSVLEVIPSHVASDLTGFTDTKATDTPLPTQQQAIQSVGTTVAKTEYQMKRVEWMPLNSTNPLKLSIITQNENGPCPLLALCNVLLLRGDIKIQPADRPVVDDEYLTSLLGEYLLDLHSTESEDMSNFNNALAVIPLLQRGLDVNVRFDNIRGFENTPELSMFEAFKVDLIHGWIVDPEEDWNTYKILTEKCVNYNTAVDLVVKGDEAEKDTNLSIDEKDAIVHEALVVRQFLENTATQLTYHGLLAISTTLPQNHLSVLFRNNHFSTLYKRADGELYTLVTDAGFLDSPNAGWERLRDIDQIDSEFVTGTFQKIGPSGDSTTQSETIINEDDYADLTEQERMDQDLALALNLQQQEEDGKKREQAQIANQKLQQHNASGPGKTQERPEASEAHEQATSVASSSMNPKKKKDNCMIC
ncbi:hypothetical protein K7432_010713 [Basidiobolus ranarum]|uniref:MINDY deubiquitinase domain-containing protein n=1 Tax=Basidiobolus ranarum TaxID=34480 RepID=A0ABR2VV56_9FUNG